MFDFDTFMEGRQGLAVYNVRDFHAFCAWASRHNLTWRNGADPSTESTTTDYAGNVLNPSGTPRYRSGRANVYIIVNGHLSQRTRSYASSNSISAYDFYRIPDDAYIDDEGFEAENF